MLVDKSKNAIKSSLKMFLNISDDALFAAVLHLFFIFMILAELTWGSQLFEPDGSGRFGCVRWGVFKSLAVLIVLNGSSNVKWGFNQFQIVVSDVGKIWENLKSNIHHKAFET